MKTYVLPFCVIFLLTEAAFPTVNETLLNNRRIINGSPGRIENLPYIVIFLIKNNPTDAYCGGSIIHQKFVLSAAHCFIEPTNGPSGFIDTSQYYLLSGTASTLYGNTHNIDQVIIHENTVVRPSYTIADIAIVRVVEPFVFDATQRPIPIYTANDKVHPGETAIISGFGRVSPNQKSKYLMTAVILIRPREECAQNNIPIDKTNICAGDPIKKKTICNGDSGGPLVIDNRLAGIVSSGPKTCNSLAAYTNVGFFHNWIVQKIQRSLLGS